MLTKGTLYVFTMESKDWILVTDDLTKNVNCWAVLSKNSPQEYPFQKSLYHHFISSNLQIVLFLSSISRLFTFSNVLLLENPGNIYV